MSLSNNQKICSYCFFVGHGHLLHTSCPLLPLCGEQVNFVEKVDSEKAEIAGDATIRPALFRFVLEQTGFSPSLESVIIW